MRSVFAFMAGLVFGLGLLLSGMTNPAKVLGFLDLAGAWDPSLAFVMAGAILIGTMGFGLAAKRRRTLLGDAMQLPTARRIDRRLVLGSVAFGVGWGLAGYCPGPALTSLLQGGSKPLVFVLAMIAGMMLYELLERIRSTSPGKAG